MTKPINTIRDIIQQMNVTDPLKVAEVLLDLLEKLCDHESLINRMDGELAKITDIKQSVPAQWYRASVHAHMKATIELLTLQHALEPMDIRDLVLTRQSEILAADSEYQRLLAEETSHVVIDPPPIWGKGLEEMLEAQKAIMESQGAPIFSEFDPAVHVVDYTKPHVFDLDKQTGLPHVEYDICKCGMSKDNKIHG